MHPGGGGAECDSQEKSFVGFFVCLFENANLSKLNFFMTMGCFQYFFPCQKELDICLISSSSTFKMKCSFFILEILSF